MLALHYEAESTVLPPLVAENWLTSHQFLKATFYLQLRLKLQWPSNTAFPLKFGEGSICLGTPSSFESRDQISTSHHTKF